MYLFVLINQLTHTPQEWIWFFILVSPFIFLLIYKIINFKKLWFDFRNQVYKEITGKVIIERIPIALKYILVNFDIKEYSIVRVSRILNNKKKKINTYFAYEIKTYNKKFHLYYYNDNGVDKWMFYKKHSFDNKPVRIKTNYYDILNIINDILFMKIKNKFNSRLLENKRIVLG